MPCGATWSLLIPPLSSLRLEGAVRARREGPNSRSTQQQQGPAVSSGEISLVLGFFWGPGLHPSPHWTLKVPTPSGPTL